MPMKMKKEKENSLSNPVKLSLLNVICMLLNLVWHIFMLFIKKSYSILGTSRYNKLLAVCSIIFFLVFSLFHSNPKNYFFSFSFRFVWFSFLLVTVVMTSWDVISWTLTSSQMHWWTFYVISGFVRSKRIFFDKIWTFYVDGNGPKLNISISYLFG